MQWRAGFFRLWLLVSALWVLIIAALFYQQITDPWIGRDQGFVFRSGEERPSVIEQYTEVYRALEELVEREEFQKVEFQDVPNIFMFVRADLPKSTKDSRAQMVYPLAVELRHKLVRERRLDGLTTATGTAFAPPLVLLLIGAAISWVIRGFAGPTIDASHGRDGKPRPDQ